MKTPGIVKKALAGLFILIASGVMGQDCFKSIKKFCRDLPYEDYDYIGQSSYASLLPGDTAQFDVIFYSYKDYKVMLCSDPLLGEIDFEIFEKIKEKKKYIKQILKTPQDPVPIYELDEYGQQKIDDYYNPIQKTNPDGSLAFENLPDIIDTIFESKIETRVVKLFDNKTQASNVYEELEVKKTKKLLIKVYIPPDNSSVTDRYGANPGGCVNLLIGNKYSRSKSFRKY
ncbi:MAG: hypothetical protein KKA07_07390 [Bacteroidetes bacterium]|nr:hypothetical protein [Bacteroidota bacterium]MBU1718884.1 hypothetical protein [Bacteroidota bacterium]